MARAAPSDKGKANKRGAARLAAVQALYQMDLAGTGLNEILAEFESHWIGREVEGEQYLPAEAAFFREIVAGVVEDQRKLDPLIDAANLDLSDEDLEILKAMLPGRSHVRDPGRCVRCARRSNPPEHR